MISSTVVKNLTWHSSVKTTETYARSKVYEIKRIDNDYFEL